MDKALKEIRQLIEGLKKHSELFLPDIERNVERIIGENITNENEIEHLLDRILDLTYLGIGEVFFFKLLDYYKTLDPEAVADYLRYYNDCD